MKLCKDCKHFIAADETCLKDPRDPDYVHGKDLGFYHASTTRGVTADCGPEAKWFEPK